MQVLLTMPTILPPDYSSTQAFSSKDFTCSNEAPGEPTLLAPYCSCIEVHSINTFVTYLQLQESKKWQQFPFLMTVYVATELEVLHPNYSSTQCSCNRKVYLLISARLGSRQRKQCHLIYRSIQMYAAHSFWLGGLYLLIFSSCTLAGGT